jgi:SAM-dependent methyltransferase
MDPREYERLAEFEEWYWWHRGRQSIVRHLLRSFAPVSARILDVGCGTGATTDSVRDFGSVVGMDIGEAALRHARARGLPVLRGSAAQLPVRPGGVDVILALDVLEHLDDDARAAREIHQALAPGGILLATVPAYAFLWSGHDEVLGHRRRYVRRRLLDVLRGAGFEVELCSYVMSSILPAAIALRLFDRWWGRGRRTSGYVLLPRPLNALLAWLVSLGGYLVRWVNLPFGLSLAAVARRPLPIGGSPRAGSAGGSAAGPRLPAGSPGAAPSSPERPPTR